MRLSNTNIRRLWLLIYVYLKSFLHLLEILFIISRSPVFLQQLKKWRHSIKRLLEMPSPCPKKISIGFSLCAVFMRMRTM
ncbi:hypothetical protein QN277_012488 [Acacia crassicarpa]|uniref:Uncharacterized protein n=1 Tax=Acacia crassicarpa TaxID=499986 RepID=A0AAE1N1W5_9FABA|nr:hypothetical protein QN277_008260 [Acacia crassicarpa]KAK4280936.1 hypothetical protein QN277_012488 [Acacia crassicarpa]